VIAVTHPGPQPDATSGPDALPCSTPHEGPTRAAIQTSRPGALSRRTLLGRLAAAGPVAWVVAACTRAAPPSDAPLPTARSDDGMPGEGAPATDPDSAVASTATRPAVALAPTPACPDDEPTPPQTEGPFYTPDTPERASLREPGLGGTPLVVVGRVVDTGCLPIAGAMLDFWHCDAQGVYDTSGYRLRGHQFADSDGRWRLETILPATYPGRTRHIHVRVQPPGGEVLTTQLYFPDEPDNARDGIYVPELEMTMAPTAPGGEMTGTFDFVLAAV